MSNLAVSQRDHFFGLYKLISHQSNPVLHRVLCMSLVVSYLPHVYRLHVDPTACQSARHFSCSASNVCRTVHTKHSFVKSVLSATF